MKNLFIHAQGRPAQSRAFTIIELMVVVAIMAILTGIVMTSLTGSKAKARDAKRISDLGQIQLALELYFDRCKEYPRLLNVDFDNGFGESEGNSDSCLRISIKLGTFISVIPKSPDGLDYDYKRNDADHPSTYVLHTTLETPNEIVKDGLDSSINSILPGYEPTELTVTCSNIPADKQYCLGPK